MFFSQSAQVQLIRRRLTYLALATMALLFFSGCTGPVRKDAVPNSLSTQAVVPGMAEIRYRSDSNNDAILNESIQSLRREEDYLASIGHEGSMPPAIFLAISGGGDDGAFGAGLLCGWTDAGNRPVFKLVTGVSTGALIAPFAFLGSAYDHKLRKFYTTLSTSDILNPRSFLAAIFNDALSDNTPLWDVLEEEVDQALMDAIAREYQKGRLLLVATVDLDARQSVLWNMTKIAASQDPKALDLFRTIMIASASIPGAFPPVMIDVEAKGKNYQEMHVDGGTMEQVFVYPPSLHIKKESDRYHVTRERRFYIIRNARLDPDWAQVERRTMSIAGRAISSLIQTQGIGDLYRIYVTAERDGADFNLAYIPASFDAPHEEEFDTKYMQALFQTGYDLAEQGYPWQKKPPGY